MGNPGGTSFDQHVAPFSERLRGSIVDLAVVGAIVVPAYLALGPLAGALMSGAAVLAYLTLPVARWGRTLGKLVAGTRVVHARDGRPPSVLQAFERVALLALPVVVLVLTLPYAGTEKNLYVFMMGVISAAIYTSALSREDVTGWHDLYAHTVVVNA